MGVSMFDFGKFAKRAWRASVPVWWEQLMLLLIALVGTWLAIHFGLFKPTDKHAAYEVIFLTAAFAIVLYMLVAIMRAIKETLDDARMVPITPSTFLEEREWRERVIRWLRPRLGDRRLCVQRAFLFGSTMHDHYTVLTWI
jgi:hypothetical protein